MLERVVVPLVEGGEVRPVPPIGARRAVNALATFRAADVSKIHAARVTAARRLYPTDHVAPFGDGQWLLACALNDLLQVPNTSLSTGDQRLLLDLADRTLERAGPPTTLAEALARYATFSLVPRLWREDHRISWWAGRRTYRGVSPPKRMLLLPELRGVSVATERVRLSAFGANEAAPEAWPLVLGRFLAASPLLDLACADRKTPRFVWSGSAVRLLGVPLARDLALRALRSAADPESATRAARDALAKVGDRALSSAIRAFLADAEVFAGRAAETGS